MRPVRCRRRAADGAKVSYASFGGAPSGALRDECQDAEGLEAALSAIHDNEGLGALGYPDAKARELVVKVRLLAGG